MLFVMLPWPPSVNTYYRHVVVKGSARVLLSSKGREYQQHAALSLAGWAVPPPPHAVRVVLHPPTRRRFDLDNFMKGLLDSVYRSIRLDDSVIDRLSIERGEPTPGGEAWVWIEEVKA